MCKDSRRRMIELETKLRLLMKKKEYKKRLKEQKTIEKSSSEKEIEP